MKSQLQQIARPMYSNPPVHGALIVSTILGDPELKSLWLKEVKVTGQPTLASSSFCNSLILIFWFFQGMADRIIGMRNALRENLEKLGSPLSWEHITNQVKSAPT